MTKITKCEKTEGRLGTIYSVYLGTDVAPGHLKKLAKRYEGLAGKVIDVQDEKVKVLKAQVAGRCNLVNRRWYADILTVRLDHVPYTEPVRESDEQVYDEKLDTRAGKTQLEWYPVRPGTVKIQCRLGSTTDDGHGHLMANGAISGGSIDYFTGKMDIGVSCSNVTASYKFRSDYDAADELKIHDMTHE